MDDFQSDNTTINYNRGRLNQRACGGFCWALFRETRHTTKKIAPFLLQVDTLEDDAFHCGLFCGSVGGRCGTLPRFSSPNPLSGAPDRWHDITGQAGSTMQRSRGPLISGARVRNPPVLWERARGVLHTLSHRNGPQMEPCCLPIQGLQSADLHFDVARRNKALSSADLYRLAD